MGTHRRPDTPTPSDEPAVPLAGTLRRNILLLATANLCAAAGIGLFAPGTSPSLALLAFYAPLPLWAIAFTIAAAFQLAHHPLIGHSIAAPLWTLLAFGAVVGLATGTSSAPAASVLLAGLELLAAGLHANGMAFRRQERQAARSDR